MNLTSAELSALLWDMGDRFVWPVRADSYRLVDQWERPRSRTVFYRMRAEPAGCEVVVKAEAGPDPVPPGQLFKAMVDLDDVVSNAALEGAHGLRPLAWLDDPPLIITPFVDGEDLVTVMRRPDDPAWDGQITEWTGRAGAMLAAFHRGSTSSSTTDIVLTETEPYEAARRLRVPADLVGLLLERVDWRSRCAPLYGDFGPGNLLGSTDGDLYLLDPPVGPPIALIHRDLANFIFELRRQLAGHGYTRYPPVTDKFEGLRAVFLDGYAATGPLSPADLGLISLFEGRRAAGMARKRFPDRIGDTVWFLRSALARRREVMRSRAS